MKDGTIVIVVSDATVQEVYLDGMEHREVVVLDYDIDEEAENPYLRELKDGKVNVYHQETAWQMSLDWDRVELVEEYQS